MGHVGGIMTDEVIAQIHRPAPSRQGYRADRCGSSIPPAPAIFGKSFNFNILRSSQT
jgi:hypothetical protein